jgi:translation elongation factor EF-Ts
MAEVNPTLVKQLRDKTNAGMMDCKKALVESDGDLAKAEDLLRKRGSQALPRKRPDPLKKAWSPPTFTYRERWESSLR